MISAPEGSETTALSSLVGLLNEADDADAKAAEELLPGGARLPVTWVSGVGEGREWDKLGLYCRFSDVRHADRQAFRSSGTPGARAVFLDLSRYENHIEVFAQQPSDMSITLSESPVDGGDSHERTKSLCDVRMLASPQLHAEVAKVCKSHGMRVSVARGTPLDVGTYHVSGPRSRLTMELTICFDGDKLPSSSSMLKREVGKASHKNVDPSSTSALIWELSIDSEGHLLWSCGDACKPVRSPSPIPDLMPPIGEDVPVGAAGAWTHVCAVVDSSQSDIGASGQVSLYVNGECVAKKKPVKFTEFAEAQLVDTTLYIAADLSKGWRVTELRAWADARTSSEIDQNRDMMLALASKRKRLQYRVKGNKQLFGALDERSFYLGAASPGDGLVNNQAAAAVGVGEEKSDADVSVKVVANATADGKGLITPISTPGGGASAKSRPLLGGAPRGAGAGGGLELKKGGLLPLPKAQTRPVGLMAPPGGGGGARRPLRPPQTQQQS